MEYTPLNFSIQKSFLTDENIGYHFLENRAWEKYFKSKYSEFTCKDYIQKAWKLFEDNGYRVEVERFSNRPESKVYSAIKSIDLFKDEEFIVGRAMVNESQALTQLLIMVICDFEVDFREFK